MTYKLVYLPIAKKDIEDILSYITEKLYSPQAALNLLESLENAILRLKDFPFSYKKFESHYNLSFEYRVLIVKNYSVFYVVNGDCVEIHRVLYAKRNLIDLLETE